MIEVTKIIEWDMGHRVPNHDNKCRFPHGHRYRLECTITGEPSTLSGSSSEGMVYDFGSIKQVLMERIHDVLDHGFMAFSGDKIIRTFAQQFPQETQVIFVPFIPTAENITVWCYEQIKNSFPPNLKITQIRLYETPNSWADFKPHVS